MGTDKRDRKKANRQARLQSEQRAARRKALLRRVVFIVVLTVGVLAVALLINLLAGDDDPEPVETGAGTTTTTEAVEATAPVTPECPAEDGSSPPTVAFDAPPPMCIDPDATYTAVLDTTEGVFTIELDAGAAPETVNNFVFLARHHYYDDVAFHRIVPGFVVQGGDAVGDPPGTGGPGYTIDDELPEAGEYQIGSVAMANSGPDTNGSQFFVVTGEQGVALPPLYSLFGTVTDGFDVVEAIEAAGTGGPDGPPRIRSVSISER